LSNIGRIIIITDLIHTTKRIFDSPLHLFQIYVLLISSELWKFFDKDHNNTIEFWDCPSAYKWSLHDIVNKETKNFHLVSNYPYKSSWDFSRKNKYNNILSRWKMTFQLLDEKSQYFLELLDDNNKLIKLLYAKGGLWLKYFEHSNSLCTRASRVIVNYVSIDKY